MGCQQASAGLPAWDRVTEVTLWGLPSSRTRSVPTEAGRHDESSSSRQGRYDPASEFIHSFSVRAVIPRRMRNVPTGDGRHDESSSSRQGRYDPASEFIHSFSVRCVSPRRTRNVPTEAGRHHESSSSRQGRHDPASECIHSFSVRVVSPMWLNRPKPTHPSATPTSPVAPQPQPRRLARHPRGRVHRGLFRGDRDPG